MLEQLPGASRIELIQRLDTGSALMLAIYFNIPRYERDGWPNSLVAQHILEWLEARVRLAELPEAFEQQRTTLRKISRVTGLGGGCEDV